MNETILEHHEGIALDRVTHTTERHGVKRLHVCWHVSYRIGGSLTWDGVCHLTFVGAYNSARYAIDGFVRSDRPRRAG